MLIDQTCRTSMTPVISNQLNYINLSYSTPLFSLTLHFISFDFLRIRFANSLSGTENFFQNKDAQFAALSALRLTANCPYGIAQDEMEVEEGIELTVREQGKRQMLSLLSYLKET